MSNSGYRIRNKQTGFGLMSINIGYGTLPSPMWSSNYEEYYQTQYKDEVMVLARLLKKLDYQIIIETLEWQEYVSY